MYNSLLWITLSIYTTYISEIILVKAILLLVIFFLFLRTLDTPKKINVLYVLAFLTIILMSYSSIFFVVFVPILIKHANEKKLFLKYIFINSLLLRFIIENIYFLQLETAYMIHFWGIPILLLAYVLYKLCGKYTPGLLSMVAVCVLISQVSHNISISKMPTVTTSEKKHITANPIQLKSYFSDVKQLTFASLAKRENTKIILAIAENTSISGVNHISRNNIYFLLAEHDNLNGFLKNYPYFNNDSFKRMAPWKLNIPHMIAPFSFALHNDVFYSANLGATVKQGTPLIWDYTLYGVPIVLASVDIVNGAVVYLWGDSDFLVNKLVPYNINFIDTVLNGSGIIYYIFSFCFIMIAVFVAYNISSKISVALLCICICLIYIPIPYTSKKQDSYGVYFEPKIFTAHNQSTPSSFLNFMGQKNLAAYTTSKNNSKIAVLNANHTCSDFPQARMIFMLSGARLHCQNKEIICTYNKIGTLKIPELNNASLVDARFLAVDGIATEKSFYMLDNTKVLCTGSPQLNTHLIKK